MAENRTENRREINRMMPEANVPEARVTTYTP